jgi:fatty-acyl-CoA synthase
MLHWNSLNTTLRLNVQSNDAAVIFLPLFHTGGWNVLSTPFFHRGAKVILTKKFDGDQILSLTERFNCTLIFGVPTTMDMMARSQKFQTALLNSVRYAIVGGEPMPLDLIDTWHSKGVPVRQGYGLTEFGPNVFSLNEEHAKAKQGSVGFPNFYIEAKVCDDAGQSVNANEIGELWLRGPSCMTGYFNNPKATQDTLTADGWLKTGDLVRQDSEGFFYVVGRKKEMYKSGGENVYPAEVERVIQKIQGVREVAVIGIPDPKWGEVGKAFIALEKSTELSEEDVVNYCQQHLAKFKVPKQVQFLASLPKTDSGKIQKTKLN